MSIVYVMGYGLTISKHLTFETEAAIRNCAQIFVLGSPDDHVLTQINSNVVDMGNLYRQGADIQRVYKDVAFSVLDAAETVETVGFLSYGHPLVLNDISRIIIEYGIKHEIVVLPSISFLDNLIAAKQLSIGSRGFQVMEASEMIQLNLKPEIRVPLFVAQIGLINQVSVRSLSPATAEKFQLFVSYIQQLYPKDHKVEIWDNYDVTGDLMCCEVNLNKLSLAAAGLTYASTLFVPGI